EAQERLPDLELDTERLIFPEHLSIQSYDLGILLGNALDNAFAACVKLKSREPEAGIFIRLISFQKGSLFFLRVENSFDGSLIRKPGMEFPMTDKEERELHGIGMLNMKHVAESYQGTVDWNAEGRVFTLAVMLKLKN
ncbi:MAG: ATP-binding protein, partial [Lachnospiraceae bacterium]|nr:ATP-binding protein [Lachnospiraceae bacterium]